MKKKTLTGLLAVLLAMLPAAVDGQVTPVDVSLTPFVCTFEESTDTAYWTFANASTDGWHVGEAVAKSGSKSLYVSNDGGASNLYTTYASSFTNQLYAYVGLKFDDEADYVFEFDWKGMGEMTEYVTGGSYYRYVRDYLRVYLVPSGLSITAAGTPAVGWIELGDELLMSSGWHHFRLMKHFGEYERGTYNLVFAWIYDNAEGSQPPAAIDNVKVRKAPCDGPVNLTVVSADATSASIMWGAPADGGSDYEVYLDGRYHGYTSTSYYDFDDLRSNRYYMVSVVSRCDDDNTSEPLTGHFRTACGQEMGLPFTEDWEHVGGELTGNAYGIWPDCWDSTLRHSAYTAVHPSYNHTEGGRFSMRLVAAGDSNLMVSAQVPATEQGLTVRFSAMLLIGQGSLNLQVGTIDSPDDPTTFEPLVTVTTADNLWHDYEFVIEDATLETHVAFLFSSTGTSPRQAFVDDIVVEETAECVQPVALWVDSTTATTAHLRWTATEAGVYQLAYGTADSLDYANNEYVTIYNGDTTFTLTDLEPLTAYHAWVRSECGVDYSPWRQAGAFNTQCTASQCEMEVALAGEAFTSYGASLDLMQNGIVVASLTSSGMARVCSTTEVTLTYHGAEYTSYDSQATVTLLNGGGDTILSAVAGQLLPGQSVGMPCPECVIPSGVHAAQLGTTSISLEWDAVDGALGYLVAIGNAHAVSVEDNAINLDGLDEGTAYEVRVSTLCASGDTSAARAYTVRTLCADMSIPYTVDFDDMPAMTVPNCWNVTLAHGSQPAFPCVMAGGTGGSQTLRFVAYAAWNLLTTPAVTLAGDQIEVTFQARIHGDGSILTAGVMTDPSDTSTYIPLTTVSGEAFAIYRFTTGTLDAEATYHVAFMYYGQDNGQYADVDNLTIRLDDGCTPPTGLHVSATEQEEISLQWDEAITGSGLLLQWRESDGEWSTAVDLTGYTLYTLEGLQSNTLYEVRLGSVCTLDTLWTAIAVRTDCGAMPLPYREDWEATTPGTWPPCWTLATDANDAAIVSNALNHTDDGNRSLRLVGGGNVIVATSRPVPLPGDNITVNLWVYADAAGLEAGVMTDPADPNTFVPLATLTSEAQAAWQEMEFSTATIDASTTCYVAFRYSGAALSSCYIDDIIIMSTPTCAYPWATFVDHTTATTVSLRWTQGSNSSYDLAYAITNDVTTATILTASDTTLTVNGLQPSTLYHAWVRTRCGSDHSDWRTFYPFATACDVEPCQLTVRCIDGDGDGWNGGATLRLYQNGIARGEASLPFGSMADVTIAEVCNSAPLVLVWHKGTFDHEISFQIINALGNIIAHHVDVTSLPDGLPFDTIESPCTHASINPVDDCLMPSNLTVANVTHNGAVVSWLPGSASDHEWQLTVGEVTRHVTERPYVLEGLTPRTTYNVTVATICGESLSEAVSTEFSTLASDGIVDADELRVNLYPNPATGFVCIETGQPALVSVIDLCGRVVATASTPPCELDISSLPRGAYHVRVVGEGGIAVRKLVVK